MSSSRGIPRTVALDRAIDVLAAVAESAVPASASALARSTGQPRATVSRTLRTFADRGLVAETPSGWVLGNELFRLARSADPQGALIEASDRPLRRLRDRADESALLAIVTGRTAMEIVTQLDGAHRLGVVGWVGADVPLHASAAGKLVLAELSQSELEAWFEEAEPVRLDSPNGDDCLRAWRGAPSCQAPRLGRDRRRAGGRPDVPLCSGSRPRGHSRRGHRPQWAELSYRCRATGRARAVRARGCG